MSVYTYPYMCPAFIFVLICFLMYAITSVLISVLICLTQNKLIYDQQYFHLSLYVSLRVSLHLSLHVSLHLSLHVSLHLSLHVSLHLSLHLSLHVSLHLSLHAPLYVCPYIYPYLSILTYLSLHIYPYICAYMCHTEQAHPRHAPLYVCPCIYPYISILISVLICVTQNKLIHDMRDIDPYIGHFDKDAFRLVPQRSRMCSLTIECVLLL